jgi:hypothetical protein
VSHHDHDFEKMAWPLFLDKVTPTSQQHGATPRVERKSTKEHQSLMSFLLRIPLSLLRVRISTKSAMMWAGKLTRITALEGYPD